MTSIRRSIHPGRGSLSAALTRGESLVGPFLKIPAAAVTEAFALAGFDFVIIDLEHGPFSIESAETLTRAARAGGISPVIRVGQNEPSAISRALDIGIDGLIIPHISNIQQARVAVEAARFHPLGERGMDVYARAAGWGSVPKAEYMQSENSETTLCLMIEGSEGLSHVEEIAALKGVDLIFVGPYDLSQSLGIPGQVRDERVDTAIRKVVQIAQANGLGVGLYVDDPDAARHYRAMGVRLLALSADVTILTDAATKLAQAATTE